MKAAAYARYSTDRQTENSIAYQLTEIEKYCTENQIPIVATFTDEGLSGTNTDRPGFQAMVSAAKAGAIDTVVIYDISRGSRDVSDWFAFRKEMMQHNVNVISATGQRLGDLTNGQDFLMELLTVGMGQVEVLNTRQKSMDGVAVKAKEGKFLGGVPPLGYDVHGGAYVINPQEAAVVRQIFELYSRGESYNYILDHIPPITGKRGRPIGKNSLHGILTNERYIGTYTWNKRRMKLFRKWAGGELNPNVVRIENAIPPIIDLDTWERVCQRMKDNKKSGQNHAKRNYLLTGLIECEACGASFVGHTSTNKRGHSNRYYCCGNKYRTRTCKCKNIPADEAEMFVVQHLQAYLLGIDFEETAQMIADKVNSAAPDLTNEQEELAQIKTKINNGVKAVLGGLNLPELEEELDRLRVRKSELEDIIQRRTAERPEVDPAAIVQLFQNAVENWNPENFKEILKSLITKIYAHVDGSYTVNVGVHISGCGGRI